MVLFSRFFAVSDGLTSKKLSAKDPGVQSGQETQFLFSEADVRDSETDYASQRALGKYFLFIPTLH